MEDEIRQMVESRRQAPRGSGIAGRHRGVTADNCAERTRPTRALSGESRGRVDSCAAALRARLVLDPSGLGLLRGHARDILFWQPHREDKAGHEPARDRLDSGREFGLRTDSSANDGPEVVLGYAQLIPQDPAEQVRADLRALVVRDLGA